MSTRPGIAIVGSGNFATALAIALRAAGYEIEAILSRSGSRSEALSLTKARRLARIVGARSTVDPRDVRAEVLWFCVPDRAIAGASRTFAANLKGMAPPFHSRCKEGFKGRVALHSSGALSSDALAALRECGMAVGSVHPLMTFVGNSRPALAGVAFAVEGDAAAMRVARRLVGDLGGKSYTIRKQDKAVYHAWGTFASPLLTALLATTEQVAGMAGVRPEAARRRMLPILRQTLENYAEFGAGRGFSGPIVRGDVDTVKRHLSVLRKNPAAREVYLALAQAALRYLPAKNRRALKKLLTSRGA